MGIVIDHTHPDYKAARAKIGMNRYNGAYYYSKEICRYFIPTIKTDRNWMTIKAGEEKVDHSIIFVHNNVGFERSYGYTFDLEDVVYVVGLPDMVERVQPYGKVLYLPLSVDVRYVERFKRNVKTKDTAFMGRRETRTRSDFVFPKGTDFIEMMPRDKLLREVSKYRRVYAIGRCAIEARILGAELLPYHPRLPDTGLWKVLDSRDAAKMLQEILDGIDGR